MVKNKFNIKECEEKWRAFWEKEGIFKFDLKSKKKIYSVDTPPPTVSGKMHIGHAASYSQQDFLIRYKRMAGFNVFYPFGTDDNGLPTERLVEKTKGIRASDMPRDKFVQLCMKLLKEKFQQEYLEDWKRIGISCDWDILYSTIDDNSRKIAQWSFLDLFKKGRVYRKDAPAMWCPECQTGISQAECEDKSLESSFNTIVFKVEGKDLAIDTTRPELLPACVAIFYHPEDKRYKSLKSKSAKVPLFDFEVKIMEDERVDPEKGTGIVMCCTFGDQTDMEWQRAYNLEIKEAIDKTGKMTSLSGAYKGMPVKEARKKIISDLRDAGLLLNQKPIVHDVKVHERCGAEIEFVKSTQWFVKYLDLKKEMLKWGENLNWHPKFMFHRYANWVKGLQWDWLISRQRYFGISFPVWYCKKCGEIKIAEEKQLPVDPMQDKPLKKCSCGSEEFIPEKDVLDTWFTSSMTPRLSIELIDKKIWENLFPMSLRPQAHDIISFWLFNTVVKSNLHYGKNPFKEVAISGFVLDPHGKKMSKSKGNVVAPQDVVEEYGADALRFWASSVKLGDDISYQEKDLVAGKKFINKILNASRFVFMNLEKYGGKKKPKKLEVLDELFLDQLNSVIRDCTESFEKYEYSKVKSRAENFFWQDFTDNYLEIVKKRVYQGKGDKKLSAQYTLYQALLTLIKLFAPITPFITEEIYQEYFKKLEKDKSIHLSEWPKEIKAKGDKKTWQRTLEILAQVRQAKSKAQKSMNSEIILSLDKEDLTLIEKVKEDLMAVTGAKEINEGEFKVVFV